MPIALCDSGCASRTQLRSSDWFCDLRSVARLCHAIQITAMALATMLFARVALCLQAVGSGAALVPPAHPLSDASPPSCVTFATEARFVGLAYNHIVHIANGCDAAKSCTVATDVNPERQAVTVPAGSTVSVVTFIGSPARTFAASVQCTP